MTSTGRAELAFIPDDQGAVLELPTGQVVPRGVPITEFKRILGGNQGVVRGPDKEEYRVEIPDEHQNRDDLRVVVSFNFRDRDVIARIRKNRIDWEDFPSS